MCKQMTAVDVEARQGTAAIVGESEVSDVYCRLRSLPSFKASVFLNLPDRWIVDGANALGLDIFKRLEIIFRTSRLMFKQLCLILSHLC